MPLHAVTADQSADTLSIEWSLSATPLAVWTHLADRTRIGEWLGEAIIFDTRRGGTIEIAHGRATDPGHGRELVCTSEVLSLRIGRSIAATWQFPDEPLTLVSLHTSIVDEETSMLTLQHSGLGPLKDSYGPGWLTHLSYFEASLDGHPLPDDEFWHLHETFARLITTSTPTTAAGPTTVDE